MICFVLMFAYKWTKTFSVIIYSEDFVIRSIYCSSPPFILLTMVNEKVDLFDSVSYVPFSTTNRSFIVLVALTCSVLFCVSIEIFQLDLFSFILFHSVIFLLCFVLLFFHFVLCCFCSFLLFLCYVLFCSAMFLYCSMMLLFYSVLFRYFFYFVLMYFHFSVVLLV